MAGITKEEQKRRAELLAKGLKVCFKCGRVLPVEQFSKNKNRKDGLAPQCKKCAAKYMVPYNKQYYRENIEERLQYAKQHYQTPQAQIVHFNSNGRRRQREEEQGAGITKQQYLEIMNFFDWKCAYSGIYIGSKENKNNRSIDHIIPISKGGEHEIWNMAPMYRPYNSSKRDTDMMEWYTIQDFYSKERLDKILAWQEYAYNKWSVK